LWDRRDAVVCNAETRRYEMRRPPVDLIVADLMLPRTGSTYLNACSFRRTYRGARAGSVRLSRGVVSKAQKLVGPVHLAKPFGADMPHNNVEQLSFARSGIALRAR